MALTKAQKEKLAYYRKKKELQETFNTEVVREGDISDELLKKQDRMIVSKVAFNKALEKTDDLEGKILAKVNSVDDVESKRGKVIQSALDVMRAQSDEGEITGKQIDLQTKLLEKVEKGEMSILELRQFQKDHAKEMTPEFNQWLKTEISLNQALEHSTEVLGQMDTLTGGMASNIANFSKIAKNPAAIGAAAIAGLVAILVNFSGQLDAIGEKFGVMGVKELSGDLMAADAQLADKGMAAGTAADIMSDLNDMGLPLDQALEMTVATADMSKALGMTTEEGAKLMGMFTTIGGLTPQQAEDTAKMAYQLAAANNVNPASVMEDIAGSSETFAKFGKDGGANLIEAAVVAKKLGTNLESVAGTMESMLNFADSTSKAMEASVMIGRDINVQKLQEASLAGDATAVLEEQKRLLGDAHKWNQMNVLERKA